jgi:glyoxylase-like metal-dependent hydrolase (beta-lactamase superfamily II)
MNRLAKLLLLTSLVLIPAVMALAQGSPQITTTRLTDKITLFSSGFFGSVDNWLASVGEDGILLVDAGTRETSQELKELLKTMGNGQVKIIISTHAHKEHTGGNVAFGKDVLKIAHASVRDRLQQGTYILEEFPPEVLPSLTFTDSLTLYFNGEKIRLIAIPGAHDDGDIIVHFTDSKIVAVGALSSGMHFPTVDNGGGNALKFPENVQRLINSVPDDVTLIAGHGRSVTIAEEKEYQKMLARTVQIVKAELAAGKDVATLQRDSILKPWISYEGGFSTMDQWIQTIANGYNYVRPLKTATVEMYYAFKAKDIDSAIVTWYDLKKNHPTEYNLTEGNMVLLGYYLLGKDKVKDAIKLFELYVKEFPDAWNSYDCLAEAYLKDGNRGLAKKYYKKSVKLNPANTNAIEIIKTL